MSLTLAICRALAHERAYSTTMDMNSMEPAGGRLSDYFTAAARRVVIPPNAKQKGQSDLYLVSRCCSPLTGGDVGGDLGQRFGFNGNLVVEMS